MSPRRLGPDSWWADDFDPWYQLDPPCYLAKGDRQPWHGVVHGLLA